MRELGLSEADLPAGQAGTIPQADEEDDEERKNEDTEREAA